MGGYYTDPEIKSQIDEVLRINSYERSNLGIDSTPKEKKQAKENEQKRLKQIKHLDPVFVQGLLDVED